MAIRSARVRSFFTARIIGRRLREVRASDTIGRRVCSANADVEADLPVRRRSPRHSSVAQWQSIGLLTGGLLVRVQPEEPLHTKGLIEISGDRPSCRVWGILCG